MQIGPEKYVQKNKMAHQGGLSKLLKGFTILFFVLMQCQAGKRLRDKDREPPEDLDDNNEDCEEWPVPYDDDDGDPSPSPQRQIPDEQRLLNKVFRTYDSSVRPVYNATSNVVVKFGLTLIQIMDMDEQDQILDVNVWFKNEWVDERIRWDPEEYSGLHVIRIPANKLWLPDIVLYNNADDFTTGYMPSNAMVSADGTVFWPPPARLRSSCKVDITFFPFDEQRCSMKFGSWSYDQAQVDIVNRSHIVDLSNYITNGEWALIEAEIMRNEVVYPIMDAVYPDVTIYYRMRRRILYYVLNILCPCIWLNVLSLLAFCLPADAGEKVSLGITVLLSYSVFMLLVAENMPPTSEFVPLICIYLTISMAVTSISVILTVCVLKLHHGGPNRKKVPDILRLIVFDIMDPLLHLRRPKIRTKLFRDHGPRRTPSKLTSDNAEVCLRLMSEAAARRHSPVAEFRNTNGKVFGSDQFGLGDFDSSSGIDTSGLHQDITRLTIMEEILRHLRTLVEKREGEDAENEMLNEWKHVASIMDRFLFLLSMVTTLVVTFVLIIIIPATRYYEGAELITS